MKPSRRLRVLYAPLNPPGKSGDGGTLRAQWLLEALREIADVDLLRFNSWYQSTELTVSSTRPVIAVHRPLGFLTRLLPRRIFHSAALRSAFRVCYHRRWDFFQSVDVRSAKPISHGSYDVVVCRYAKALSYLSAWKMMPRTCFLDVDDHDLASLQMRLSAPNLGTLPRCLYQRAERQIREFYEDLLGRADHIWVSNPEDLEHVAHPSASVLPNLPGLDARILPPSSEPRILCVSSYGNEGNRIGLARFIQEVWPVIRRATPNATLEICGAHYTPAARRELNAPGICCHGFVEDLRPFYERALFTIAPVAFGGGTNIKVVESCSQARACVLTPAAARGYGSELRDCEGIMVAETRDQFASRAIDLLRDIEKAHRLGKRAYEAVSKTYVYSVFRDAVHLPFKRIPNGQTPIDTQS